MLQFRDVTFQYPGEAGPIVDKLSFRVEQGEFVCLVGPSGCGKSTLFRLINGLLTPDKGEVLVGGRPVKGAGGYCGYMPQRDMLMPWRTVAESVRLPLEVQGGRSEKEMDGLVDKVLSDVGLKAWRNHRPDQLSGGMRQRVAFARTVLTGSDLLLLDEPFSSLDYLNRLSMREWLLAQWERERKTVVFITHDVEEALFLSSRVLAVRGRPISRLASSPVPAPYPRTIVGMQRREIMAIKEGLITMLRRDSL